VVDLNHLPEKVLLILRKINFKKRYAMIIEKNRRYGVRTSRVEDRS
jgi:hypothetical protein